MDDFIPDYQGWVHEDELPDLEHAKDMLESIINAIYVSGDIHQLEDCLDELTGCFDLELPRNAPVLEKTEAMKIQSKRTAQWS